MSRERHAPLGRSVRSISIPKAGGGQRRLTVLGPDEAAAYARAVGRLTPAIERRLGPEVFANRAPGAGSLEPWRTARARWKRSAAALLRTGPIATMDVSQCYESITPEAAARALGELHVSDAAVREVVGLLGAFRRAGVPGIPVGPEPSAILANAVLAGVDEGLRGQGVAFVRWVDDLVLSPSHPAALGAGERAVETALAELGLVSNPAKHHRFADVEEARASVLGRGAGAGSTIEILVAP